MTLFTRIRLACVTSASRRQFDLLCDRLARECGDSPQSDAVVGTVVTLVMERSLPEVVLPEYDAKRGAEAPPLEASAKARRDEAEAAAANAETFAALDSFKASAQRHGLLR